MAEGKRRAESDARLEYIYSYISDITGISRSDLPEQLHNAGLVAKVQTFLQPRGPSSLLVYFQEDVQDVSLEPQAIKPKAIVQASSKQHQHAAGLLVPKKKLAWVEGNKLLNGIAIHFLRTASLKPVTEDNYNKEVMCGLLDARQSGLGLCFMHKIIEKVFIPCLMGISESTSSSSFSSNTLSTAASLGSTTVTIGAFVFTIINHDYFCNYFSCLKQLKP